MQEKPKTNSEETPQTETGSTRREFLKTTGVGFFAFLLANRPDRASAFLQEGLNKEKKGGEPQIEVEIFFAPHATREDARGLAEKIKETDVFAPEFAGWSKKASHIFSEISKGKISSEEFEKYSRNSFELAVFEGLSGSKKIVDFFDLPREHPAALDGSRASHEMRLNPMTTFASHVALWKEAIKKFIATQRFREDYIKQKLQEFKRRATQGAILELKEKEKIKILMLLGDIHTTLYHSLRKDKEDISQSFRYAPYVVFGYRDEAVRQGLLGKEITDKLVARAVFEMAAAVVLKNDLQGIAGNTQERDIIFRRVVETFNDEEIQSIGDKIITNIYDPTTRNFLLHKLLEKGVRLPTSEEEIKKLTSRRGMPKSPETKK